jgi:enoyl-CoA hydratase/carnithine racemase
VIEAGAVLLHIEGPLARITLNRPQKLNAMNGALLDGLEAAVDAVTRARAVRVVLLAGAGRAFSSGLDLDMRAAGVPLDFFERQERVRRRLEALEAITIAALHGHCLGGGLQLAIACDLRVCSSDCRLGLPAVMEGLFPGLATVRLPRLIGLGPARRLILSGESIGAPAALQQGLIDHLVPAERFAAGTAEVVQTYLNVPRAAAAASKRLMGRAFEAPLESLKEEMLPLMAECLASPDATGAAAAWRERQEARRRGEAPVSQRRALPGSRTGHAFPAAG